MHSIRNNKRIICIIISVICVFLLTACSDKKVVNSGVSQMDSGIMGGHEDGYYFVERYNNSAYIYYYPVGSKEAIPLCSKSNCTHFCDGFACAHGAESEDCEVKDCDALLGYQNDTALNMGIRYYNGKLYVLMPDEEGLHLYSISKDGTAREKVCTIDENAKAYIRGFTIHNGYVYTAIEDYYDNIYHTCIYKMELKENSVREVIFEEENSYMTINYMKGYDDGIYFIFIYDCNEENEELDLDVRYQLIKITEKGIEKLFEGKNIDGYCINENKIYYHCVDDSVLYGYDMSIGADEPLYTAEKNMYYSVWADDEHIYLDNCYGCKIYMFEDIEIQEELTVLKRDGSLVNKIYFEAMEEVMCPLIMRGGDERYFFLYNIHSLYAYDKTQITDGRNELIKIWERE